MSIEKIKELRERSGAGIMDIKKALDASNDNIELAIEWLRTNGIVKAAKKSNRIAAEGAVFLIKNDTKSVMIEINSETDFVALNNIFIKESNKIVNAILNSNIKSGDLAAANLLKIGEKTINDILINMNAIIGEKIFFRRFVTYEGPSGIYKHANNRIGAIVTGDNIDVDILRDVAMHVAAMTPEFLSKDDITDEMVTKETFLAKKELADALKGKSDNIKENIIKGKVNKILSEGILLEQAFVKDTSKKIKDLSGSGKFTSFIRYEVGEGIDKREENFAEEVAKQIN